MKYAACCRRVWVLPFLLVATSGLRVAQGDRPIEHAAGSGHAAPGELERFELEGVVHDPAGTPVAGVVVVSSAGGKALTGADGAYRLELRVPPGTRSVQVTAVGARGLVASTPAALPSGARSGPVPPLWLALGNACSPSWLPTFGGTGTGDSVAALAVYDDGSGPALYVAGSFLSAGGAPANRIAKWDGSRWQALGAGVNAAVQALAVHDDGSGPALFVGGSFTTAGGMPAGRIAKWNGTSWAAVGGGMGNGSVGALTVFDDGGGAALYAGGFFTLAGGMPANRIARWNGATWSALGDGLNAFVSALAVHDDGGGPALYAGGAFGQAGGASANHVARWNGSSWSALGNGVAGNVYALAVHDAGGGPALYAGGYFLHAGGATVNHIARWNGSTWAAVGSGFNDAVRTLRVFDDGSGAKLWAGGDFEFAGTYYDGTLVNHIAAWNGSSWQPSGSGMEGGSANPNDLRVLALCSYDSGDGPALFAGGRFARADGACVNNLARRHASSWKALGRRGIDAAVRAVVTYDDGTGPALYVGGDFVTIDGVVLDHVARWDGSGWTSVGGGVNGNVHVLLVHDDGSGPALFAGGAFGLAGGVPASRIARWDGSSWSALDVGLSLGDVHALAVHDDGGGPALYAGGTFLLAGGAFGTLPVNRIARWDGTGWDDLGTGVNTQGSAVNALASYGSALYAGGDFASVGEVPVDSIARWNGASWAGVAGGMSGLDDEIETMAVFGGSLYVGGRFSQAGGVWSSNIARWNGTGWFALSSAFPPSGLNQRVSSLWVHDDGSGAKLHAGGGTGVARWNGTAWAALGSGGQSAVLAMATFDSGSGPSLLAGGEIGTFFDSGDSFLGEWGCDRLPPTIHAPPAYAVDRPTNGPGELVTFSVQVRDVHDPTPAVSFTPPSGSWFPRGTTWVTCTATDDWGNQAIVYFPVLVYPKARPR